jgi:hypothetical protein
MRVTGVLWYFLISCNIGYEVSVSPTTHMCTTRLRHGYENTRGVLETGQAGTGTVCKMPTRGHTATRNRGIAGLYGYKVQKYLLFFTILFIIFTILFTTLFTTWGEKSTTIQHFIGFWSAHRPFVSVCLARSTLELSLFRCHTLVVTHSHCRHYTLAVTVIILSLSSLRHVTSHLTPTPQARKH